MIADGVFDTTRPDEIFALHTSGVEVGRIVTKSGAMLPARDVVTVSLRAPSNRSDLAASVSASLAALATPVGASAPDPFVTVQSQQSQWVSGLGEWRMEAMLYNTLFSVGSHPHCTR